MLHVLVHALIAKEIDARATQAGNFLKLNKKLSIPKEYYDPRYEKMPEESVVDELVQSRNFVGRMRAMRGRGGGGVARVGGYTGGSRSVK